MRSAERGVRNKIRTKSVSPPNSAFEKWSPRSDSHRRIRVYETRPVAAEAQGQRQIRRPKSEGRRKPEFRNPNDEAPRRFGFLKWRSHVDLHHELPPSQSGVQNSLHLESVANDETRSPNDKTADSPLVRISSFVILSVFVIRNSDFEDGIRDRTCTD